MFGYSVDCGASFDFAWSFWTDVSNWRLDPDVESVELYGCFAAGARGVMNSRSSRRVEWRIVKAQDLQAATVFALSNASVDSCGV
jgi:hypothetical protein